MFKKRDAQQLSMTVIILAVLGLIVLVVLLFIFGRESSKTVEFLENCEVKGGKCKFDVAGGGCDSTEVLMSNAVCPDKLLKKRVCCGSI